MSSTPGPARSSGQARHQGRGRNPDAERARGERRAGIRIGRFGAVPVYLRPSWFAIAVVVTVIWAPAVRTRVAVGPGTAHLIALGFAVLLLVSVLVHELAHAASAAVTGTPATRIVLDLWGGHTSFEEEPAGPWRSVLVSAAGPVSNAVIAGAVEVVLRVADPHGVTWLMLVATSTSNLVVAVFNALPGLPLDGGRVLEALVWWVSGDRHTGTVVAAWCGRGLAVLTLVLGVDRFRAGDRTPTGWIWYLLIAGLLWQGAGQAIAAAHWYRQAGRVTLGRLLQPAVAVASSATVASALLAAAGARARSVVVLDVYGRPASILDEQAAAGVPPGRSDQVRASVLADPLPEGAVLESGLAGELLVRRLQDRPAARYAVVDAGEQVVGVLDWVDVAEFLGRAG